MHLKLNRFGLKLHLLLFLVTPLVVVLAVAGFIGMRSLESRIQARMEEDVQLIARAIRLPLSYALERGRLGGLEQALSSAFRFDRVYGVYLYDEQGHTIAATGQTTPDTSSNRIAEMAADGERKGEFEQIGGERVFSYFMPLTSTGGRIIGLLQITRQGSEIQDYIEWVRWRGIGLLAFITVALTAVVLLGHYRAIGRPLHAIGRHMARIEGGDRHHRIVVDGPRELAALGDGINAMLDGIDRADMEIARRRSEQSELERRLRQSQKMAAIGQLAAGVAHELGAPMSVVNGMAQRLLRSRNLPARANRSLEEIREAMRRMERIVAQLLDFARQNPLRRRRERAAHLAAGAVSQVRGEAMQHDTALALEGERPGPALEVDGLRVEQVLVNLLRNSMQAAPGGHVRLSWEEAGDEIRLIVEDDGPGIPESDKSRLFEPFFTTKSVGEGTGLGLAVVHGIVEEHGGRVIVEDSPLGGARFVVCLPRHPADAARDA